MWAEWEEEEERHTAVTKGRPQKTAALWDAANTTIYPKNDHSNGMWSSISNFESSSGGYVRQLLLNDIYGIFFRTTLQYLFSRNSFEVPLRAFSFRQ